jgi:hypothetical protein
MRLTSPLALSNNIRHLVDLALRTAEGAESLLCELAGTLVFAVAEEFDDAALVGCEAVIDDHVSKCVGGVRGGVGNARTQKPPSRPHERKRCAC